MLALFNTDDLLPKVQVLLLLLLPVKAMHRISSKTLAVIFRKSDMRLLAYSGTQRALRETYRDKIVH